MLFEQAPTKIEFQTEVFESGGRVRSVFYTVVRVVSFFGDGAFYCRGRVVESSAAAAAAAAGRGVCSFSLSASASGYASWCEWG